MNQRDIQILSLYLNGVLTFGEKDGYTMPYRFSQERMEYYKQAGFEANSIFQAGIVLKCDCCREISFDCFGFSCSWTNTEKLYVLDVFCDGKKQEEIKLSLGENRVQLAFDGQDVSLYFPYDAEVGLKNVCVIGRPHKNNGTLLFYGDSITQGFMTSSHSGAYTAILGRNYNAQVFNQGIGGYPFDENVLEDRALFPGLQKVFVAYGTNDWNFELDFYAHMCRLFRDLHEKYAGIPVYVILPPARKTQAERKKAGTLADMRGIIEAEARKYPRFSILRSGEGITVETQLCPDGIHPNDRGAQWLGEQLYKELSSCSESEF